MAGCGEGVSVTGDGGGVRQEGKSQAFTTNNQGDNIIIPLTIYKVIKPMAGR